MLPWAATVAWLTHIVVQRHLFGTGKKDVHDGSSILHYKKRGWSASLWKRRRGGGGTGPKKTFGGPASIRRAARSRTVGDNNQQLATTAASAWCSCWWTRRLDAWWYTWEDSKWQAVTQRTLGSLVKPGWAIFGDGDDGTTVPADHLFGRVETSFFGGGGLYSGHACQPNSTWLSESGFWGWIWKTSSRFTHLHLVPVWLQVDKSKSLKQNGRLPVSCPTWIPFGLMIDMPTKSHVDQVKLATGAEGVKRKLQQSGVPKSSPREPISSQLSSPSSDTPESDDQDR